MPGVARSKYVIDGRADRDMRVMVGRGIVHSSPQLIFRMIGADGDIVGALRGERARREFISRQRLHFVRQRDGIFAFEIFLGCTVYDLIDGHVCRNLIALHQVHLKENELGRITRELELVPIQTGGCFDICSTRRIR